MLDVARLPISDVMTRSHIFENVQNEIKWLSLQKANKTILSARRGVPLCGPKELICVAQRARREAAHLEQLASSIYSQLSCYIIRYIHSSFMN